MSNICFASHANAYICNNIRYNTYQEACTANGLLSNENEAEIAFNEAIIDSTPSELRSLFVILTLQGFPTINMTLIDAAGREIVSYQSKESAGTYSKTIDSNSLNLSNGVYWVMIKYNNQELCKKLVKQ